MEIIGQIQLTDTFWQIIQSRFNKQNTHNTLYAHNTQMIPRKRPFVWDATSLLTRARCELYLKLAVF